VTRRLAAAVVVALSAGAALAQAPTPSPPAPAPSATPPTSLGTATLAAPPLVIGLMGRRIFTPDAQEIGRVVDVVVDAEGRPVAMVVDVGGFLGLGSRRIALAWGRLDFRAEEQRVRIVTSVPPDQISAAPEYKPGDSATIYDPAGSG